MAIYEFRCSECKYVQEVIQPMSSANFEDRECPSCGGVSRYTLESAPALATSTFSQSPLDVAIGRDAEKRWKTIHQRKEVRDKFRKESGTPNLSLSIDSEGQVYGKALKGGHLEAVSVPENSINKE